MVGLGGLIIPPPGLSQLARLLCVDVGEIGVGGAKDFFESKIKLANKSNQFAEEVRNMFLTCSQIKQEQDEKKKELEEKKKRQEEFKSKQSNFV